MVKLMLYKAIIYEKKGFVGSITLNRPDSGNAITTQLSHELADVCAHITSDEEVRVVIITGAGKHFCIGTDPAEKSLPTIARAILNIDRPVIAAINGDALGQGLELALACDLRVATDTAHFGLPQIISGFIPSDGGTQLLPRIIGKGRAMEMIMTAGMIDANQALQYNLVNHVVAQEELIEFAEKLAGKIMRNSLVAISSAIKAVNANFETGVNGFEVEVEEFGNCFGTADFKEGTSAFLNKRKADFPGE